jgi:ketosteroid isomerase-like protein
MSFSARELLLGAYEAFNRMGVDAFEALLAPELRWQERARSAAFNPATREEVLSRMRALPSWREVLMEPQEVLEADDRLIVVVRERPRAGARNAPEERTRTHVWTIKDGQATRLEIYRKRSDAMWSVVGYLRLLERLHAYLRPRTYVEIGVSKGHSAARALPGTKIIGIDPAPRLFDPAIASTVEVFRYTSDDYFANNDLSKALDGRPIDLAFIDGYHMFEYALRDFMNLEPYCSEQSVILAHDCYPISRETSTRERTTAVWSGDVWKLVVCLREVRKDLDVHVVDVRPTGLAIITGLDPNSTMITSGYDEIVSRYTPTDYDVLEEAKEERLARVDNDWEAITQLLPEPYQDTSDGSDDDPMESVSSTRSHRRTGEPASP